MPCKQVEGNILQLGETSLLYISINYLPFYLYVIVVSLLWKSPQRLIEERDGNTDRRKGLTTQQFEEEQKKDDVYSFALVLWQMMSR